MKKNETRIKNIIVELKKKYGYTDDDGMVKSLLKESNDIQFSKITEEGLYNYSKDEGDYNRKLFFILEKKGGWRRVEVGRMLWEEDFHNAAILLCYEEYQNFGGNFITCTFTKLEKVQELRKRIREKEIERIKNMI